MRISHRHSIRDRLFAAFGVLSVLTLVTSFIGWSLHQQLGNQLKSVVEKDIPSLGLMVQLSTQAATITSLAPALIAAKSDKARRLVWQQLNQGIDEIDALLPDIPHSRLASDGHQQTLGAQLRTITSSLEKLNQNALLQLALGANKEAENQRLRWAVSGFLDHINPLIENTSKLINSRFHEDIRTSDIVVNHPGERSVLRLNTDLQILFRLKADTSLLVNLVGRAMHLPDPDSLIATAIQADELRLDMPQYLKSMGTIPGYSELRTSVGHVLDFVERDLNMFELRRLERLQREDGHQILANIEAQLQQFNRYINVQVAAVGSASLRAVDEANYAISRGKQVMITTALASIILSILIVWLYVAKHLVGRIQELDGSMRIIAAGNLHQPVPVHGKDEIGTMANSLRSFRDQLTEKQAELVQAGKLAALGQLSAGISHEINHPLTAIGHYARNGVRLLEQQRSAEATANFEEISSLTKRATAIITRLKSMARKRRDSVQPVCLNEVVEHVLTLLQSHPQSQKTHVSVAMGAPQNVVLGEQIQLEQVVLNLLSNALDAVASNSDQKIINISCEQSHGQLELRVADNGPGVAPEFYEQIFNPFFTTKEVDEGLGLGLSISYNIIQDFGGQLTVLHNPNQGAVFCMRLPFHNNPDT